MDNNNLVESLKSIHREIAMGKELLTPIKKTQMRDSAQVYILSDIIETWLLFNYL